MSAEKTKLLIVSLNFPFPVNNGGAIAQTFFLEKMQNEFDLHIATIEKNERHITDFKSVFPAIKVSNFHNPQQEVKPGLLFNMKLQLSRAVKRARKQKNIGGAEDHLQLDYIRNLVNVKSDDFLKKLNALITTGKFEIIQLEFFETIDLVVDLPENCLKVFVSHELRSKRIKLAAQHSVTSVPYQDYLFKLTALYEYNLLKKFDKVVVFNTDDLGLLEREGVPVALSPYAIPASLHIRSAPSARFGRFLFIGGESHFPNKEGLTWFLESIYFKAGENAVFPIYIIGEWSPEFKMRYIDKKAIHFVGQQPEIYKYFDNSILLAPILSGSGLRTKILDAMVNFLPVYCTTFACEGIDFTNAGKTVLYTFNSVEEFNSLLATPDSELAETAVNAKHFYDAGFNTDKLVYQRLEMYRALVNTKAVN